MEKILKLKTQYIFVLLLSPWLISVFIDDSTYYALISIIGYFIYFSLLLVFYDFLYQFLKNKNNIEYIIYFIICITFLLTYAFVAITFKEGEGVEFKGFNGFIVAIIYFLAFGFIYYSLSINLINAENKKATKENVFNYFILFLLLPIGIWFLIPKFRKLINETN